MPPVPVDDVVHEEHPLVFQRGGVLEHLFGRAKTVPAPSGTAHRTKLAVEGASPTGFQRAGEQIILLLEQLASRNAVAPHVEQLLGPVDWLELAAPKIWINSAQIGSAS